MLFLLLSTVHMVVLVICLSIAKH